MKDLKAFDLDIYNLRVGKHEYDFEGDDSFFASFEQSLIEKGSFKVKLIMDKSATMLQLHFHITGFIEQICDRSNEPFNYPLDISERHILKFGEEDKELSDEIEIIDRNTQRINVAQYIYEFIGLSVPIKKIHPRFLNDQFEETDEALLIYLVAAGARQR